MSSLTQPTNRVGQWVGAFQKKVHSFQLPAWVGAQQSVSSLVPQLVDGMRLPPSRRLVVIVPGAGIDYYALANKLWSLASPDHREILLIGVFDRSEHEFQARRNLTSLAAATRDKSVKVQVQTVESSDLLGALRQAQQEGDILLCPGQMTTRSWISKRNLPQALAGKQTSPLYCLDLAIEEDRSWFASLRLEYVLTFLALLSVIAMVAILFWLHQVTGGGVRSFFEFATILVEARVIWMIASYPHWSQ